MIEDIMDFIEENQKHVLFTLLFWAVILVCLWIVPAKMNLGGSVSSQLMVSFFGFQVKQMFLINMLVTVLSLPAIFFIIVKMTGDN